MTTNPNWTATLSNPAGPLDTVEAVSDTSLARKVARMLATGQWPLSDGDRIVIEGPWD